MLFAQLRHGGLDVMWLAMISFLNFYAPLKCVKQLSPILRKTGLILLLKSSFREVHLTLNDRSYNTLYFSPMPSPLPDLGGGLTVLPLLLPSFPSLPSAASLSRKSCHSSAKLSLLLELLAINIGSLIEPRLGVLGVLRKGLMGTPSRELVPGRARPACSFCSVFVSICYGADEL